jgi:hypothetical protein
MSKVVGADKIRRTCQIRGREAEGRFGLIRKQLNVSKVVTPGTENEEDVDTALVYDEWIVPKQARIPTKTNVETKIYPADKPSRRVCFVDGPGRDPNQRYHLLRKGAELSKVLEIGQAGQGFWINTSQIRDEHMVPVPTKARVVERKPVRLCKLTDTGDQEYLVLRKTIKGAKLLPVYDGNYGLFVTDLSRITDDHVINEVKKGKKGRKDETTEQGDDGEQIVAEQDGAVAPVVAQPAPVVAQPVHQAHPAQQPVRPAPAVAQPGHQAQPGRPVPTAVQPGQPGRPAPTVVQPTRPAPVVAGAARPVPQGRPVGR